MDRIETSTAQVNAAVAYLLHKGAKIAGPIREINHFNLRKVRLPEYVPAWQREDNARLFWANLRLSLWQRFKNKVRKILGRQ